MSQARQTMRQIEGELERNRAGNAGVLKATSGNATKRLKMRQETRITTRAGKSAEATKQLAAQELQAEKGRMQEWKENVMQKVASELQVIKQTQEATTEAKRLSFQMELELVRGKLEFFESKTKSLADEIRLLKSPGQYPAQRLRPAKGISTTSSNEQEGERRQSEEREISRPTETHKVDTNLPNPPKQSQSGPLRKSYAQIAKDNPTRLSSENTWTEVKIRRQKTRSGQEKDPRARTRRKENLIPQGRTANKIVRGGYYACS